MAFETSYVNGEFLEGLLSQTINPNWDTDAVQVALYTNDITGQNKNAQESYSTNGEIISNGYTAKGLALDNPTFTASNGKIIFDEDDPFMSWTGVTAEVRGCIIFDDTLITPYNDPVICALNFGPLEPVVDGTFTISWNATNGIFYATY